MLRRPDHLLVAGDSCHRSCQSLRLVAWHARKEVPTREVSEGVILAPPVPPDKGVIPASPTSEDGLGVCVCVCICAGTGVQKVVCKPERPTPHPGAFPQDVSV